MVNGFTFSEIGDELIIDSNIPVIGIKSIESYSDSLVGVTINRFFRKFFSYSIDNRINWSEWIELNDSNLQKISPKENHVFSLKYKYIRNGTDTTGLLEFVDIQIQCEFEDISDLLTYKKFTTSKLIDFLTIENLNWAISVLGKIYDKGIVASYIDRGINDNWQDEDYIDFWWGLIYINSIVVNYTRKLSEVPYNKDLLNDFLRTRGVFCDQNKDLDKLTYLAKNYYSELRKRGTISIINKESNGNYVNGELLRLISYKNIDEFIFCLCGRENTGWVLNNSSPCYKGLRGITNCIKGYEFTKSFVDKTKYPLINGSELYVLQDSGKGVAFMSSELETGVGDTVVNNRSTNLDKLISIDRSIDYEIIFSVKKDDNAVLNISVNGYNGNGLYISEAFVSASNFSIFTNKALEDFNNGAIIDYTIISLILYNSNTGSANTSKIIDQEGNHLKFSDPRVSKIIPNITSSGGDCYIYDLKIRPLKTQYSRCFLNIKDLVLMWYKNNNKEILDSKIEENIVEYLLPYNTRLLTTKL